MLAKFNCVAPWCNILEQEKNWYSAMNQLLEKGQRKSEKDFIIEFVVQYYYRDSLDFFLFSTAGFVQIEWYRDENKITTIEKKRKKQVFINT